MRPNNRQRSRGGRNGGGGGNHNQHKQQHNHNPNRPPNRNQIFDSSGPDVRVRGNAHQVFDKYQALAREAAASGDRIQAEAYWQYADHYFRVIQTQGGFVPRNNWGDGSEDGQQNPQQDGQPQQQDGQPQQHDGQSQQQPQANGANGGDDSYASNDRQGERQQGERPADRPERGPERGQDRNQDRGPDRNQSRNQDRQERRGQDRNQDRGQDRGADRPSSDRNDRGSDRQNDGRDDQHAEVEPGLGGVAFLQSGRSLPSSQDPAIDEQPEVPEFRPSGRRGA